MNFKEHFGYGIYADNTKTIDKNKVREELEKEMSEFLARGGVITDLSIKDRSKEPHIFNNKSAEYVSSHEKAMYARNEKKRLKAIEDRKDPFLIEQSKILNELKSKFKKGDQKRFCLAAQISDQTFHRVVKGELKIQADRWHHVKECVDNFKPYEKPLSENAQRMKRVAKARQEAQEKGLTEFKAECAKHGMTKYVIVEGRGAICFSCNTSVATIRAQKNRKVMYEAISNGFSTFTGECGKCGNSEMRIKNPTEKNPKHKFFCISCEKKQRMKRRGEGKPKHEKTVRNSFNRVEMLKAVESGNLTFMGKCRTCGDAEMRLIKTNRSGVGYSFYCIGCKKVSQRKTEKNRKDR